MLPQPPQNHQRHCPSADRNTYFQHQTPRRSASGTATADSTLISPRRQSHHKLQSPPIRFLQSRSSSTSASWWHQALSALKLQSFIRTAIKSRVQRADNHSRAPPCCCASNNIAQLTISKLRRDSILISIDQAISWLGQLQHIRSVACEKREKQR